MILGVPILTRPLGYSPRYCLDFIGRFLEFPVNHNFVEFFLNCWVALSNKEINKFH